MAELKPCPFCGNAELEICDYTDMWYGFWDYMIKCSSEVKFLKQFKRCKKCGKIVEYIYREYEGNGYK